MDQYSQTDTIVRAGSLTELRRKGRLLVKLRGRQIAIFHIPGDAGRIYACNNRCPHEGYPLIEGSLNSACELTCNWHNWKFDLSSGRTLIGGDQLRRYAVSLDGDDVLLDLSDPPLDERIAAILCNLRAALPEHEFERIARELARLLKAGGDPLDGVRSAIEYSHDRFEFGSGHAYAACADWLQIHAALCAAADPADPASLEITLVPLLEAIGHMAWDTLRQRRFPFATETLPWEPRAFAAAIEAQDEASAVARLRGALEQGLGFAELRRAFLEAALAHYQGFGHALIYTRKAGQLIEALGDGVAGPVLLALVRYLCNAAREDLIPEFRAYAPALAAYDARGSDVPEARELVQMSIKQALEACRGAGADPQVLYSRLLHAAALQMLHFDHNLDLRSDNPVSQNANWLDFSHALTFANALRWAAGEYPHLWPPGLLQLACFIGRNHGFLDPAVDAREWACADPLADIEASLRALLDHQHPEYIVSCHYLKLQVAMGEELRHDPRAPWGDDLGAALKRLRALPIKRKHLLRVAHQALGFVNKED